MLSPISWGVVMAETRLLGDAHDDGAGAAASASSPAQKQAASRQQRFRQQARPPRFVDVLRQVFGSGGGGEDDANARRPLTPVYHRNPLQRDGDWARLAHSCCDWGGTARPEVDVAGVVSSDGDAARPLPGTLPPSRVGRKRDQVMNMCVLAAPVVRAGVARWRRKQQQNGGGGGAGRAGHQAPRRRFTVVDFCCGSGWQSLPLAARFPAARFLLVDCKAESLHVARQRSARAGLGNVECVCATIEEALVGVAFDLGLALHACGQASDVCMDLCLRAGAAFVVAPCCVGKVQAGARYTVSRGGGGHADPLPAPEYPRSAAARAAMTRAQFDSVAKAADFGHGRDVAAGAGQQGRSGGGDDSTNPAHRRLGRAIALGSGGGGANAERRKQKKSWARERRLCKSLVEWDRATACCEGHRFRVWLTVMEPPSCTPKNDLMLGLPPPLQHGGAGGDGEVGGAGLRDGLWAEIARECDANLFVGGAPLYPSACLSS